MSDSTNAGWLFAVILLLPILWLFVIVLCLYGYFLLFKIGYWWMIPILIITHMIATALTAPVRDKNIGTYFILILLEEILFISLPFIMYAYLNKGQGNANNGRRNRPVALQRPRTV